VKLSRNLNWALCVPVGFKEDTLVLTKQKVTVSIAKSGHTVWFTAVLIHNHV
jgi:hypothetical protein